MPQIFKFGHGDVFTCLCLVEMYKWVRRHPNHEPLNLHYFSLPRTCAFFVGSFLTLHFFFGFDVLSLFTVCFIGQSSLFIGPDYMSPDNLITKMEQWTVEGSKLSYVSHFEAEKWAN